MRGERVLVTGAGGFIGHHLVRRLKSEGNWVRGADLKDPEFGSSAADEFWRCDLRNPESCLRATRGIDYVFNLAADMGGIGYITAQQASIACNNVLINVHMLAGSRVNKVKRYLYSSSACVYPQARQCEADAAPLKEDDAWPADPEPGYGLEKLYSEKLCEYFEQDYGLETRVVRFHNVYGPAGSYDGGKEKSPAAICRKVALAQDGDTVDVWGDGLQMRSYMYVDDCVEGLLRIMRCGYSGPLNLGTERAVTINELVDVVAHIAGKSLGKRHDLSRPQGVRGRNSDNTLLRHTLGWEPCIPLEEGLRSTYHWIDRQLRKHVAVQKAVVVASL